MEEKIGKKKIFPIWIIVIMVIIMITVIVSIAVISFSGKRSAGDDNALDAGYKYLDDMEYELAIASFTEVIDIDPMNLEARAGRAAAYLGLGEEKTNLEAAMSDYEAMLEIDKLSVEAWLGKTDIYIRCGDYENALKTIQEAAALVDDERINEKLQQMLNGTYSDSWGRTRRGVMYSNDGEMEGYTDYHYDVLGRLCEWEIYNREDGDSIAYTCKGVSEYDEYGREISRLFYDANGDLEKYDVMIFNDLGQRTEQHRYNPDGSEDVYFIFFFDENGNEYKNEGHHADGTLYQVDEIIVDEEGNIIGRRYLDADGNVTGTQMYE